MPKLDFVADEIPPTFTTSSSLVNMVQGIEGIEALGKPHFARVIPRDALPLMRDALNHILDENLPKEFDVYVFVSEDRYLTKDILAPGKSAADPHIRISMARQLDGSVNIGSLFYMKDGKPLYIMGFPRIPISD